MKRATRRSAGFLVATLLLIGSRASAFTKVEHDRLSTLALWLAHERICAGETNNSAACRAAANLLIQPTKTGEGQEEPFVSFGAFTRAGDFFTHTERIVPDPEACQRQDATACPDDLFAVCQEPGDACWAAVVKRTEERIRKRERCIALPLRLAATHRNWNHFRGHAAGLYDELHLRAVRQAREGRWEVALRTEAVALHFLQDLFAAGHLASPRSDFADAVSGSLHDRYNRKGIPFSIVPRDEWFKELQAAEGVSSPAPIHFEKQDLEAFRGVLEGNGGSSLEAKYLAKGDGALLNGPRLDDDGRSHRTFLLLASAWSVRQVLESVSPDDDLLAICFQPQSARVGRPGQPKRERGAEQSPTGNVGEDGADDESRTTVPDSDTLWAPGATLTLRRALPPSNRSGLCQPEGAGAFAGYETNSPTRQPSPAKGRDPLTRFNARIDVLELAWSPFHWGAGGGGNAGDRWELAWAFWGVVPVSELEQRGEADQFLGDRFKPFKWATSWTWGLAGHFEEHPDYEVWATGLQVSGHVRPGKKRLWDLYLILEPGMARYSNQLRDTTRWRGSLRLGVGYGVLFGELGAERGFALNATGDGHREWRYFAGTRVRFPASWFRKLAPW